MQIHIGGPHIHIKMMLHIHYKRERERERERERTCKELKWVEDNQNSRAQYKLYCDDISFFVKVIIVMTKYYY